MDRRARIDGPVTVLRAPAGWNRARRADSLVGMSRHVALSIPRLALMLAAASGACDRSLTGGPDVDLAALEALAGPTAAGRTVASDLIAVATRLQSADVGVPDIALPTLAELFARAVAVEAEAKGADAALRLRAGHAALLDSAWHEIENGDAGDGDRLLEAAREFQAASAARVLGTPTSMAYVFLVGRALQRIQETLLVLDRQGGEVRRLLRMASSARDLQMDARSALGRGQAAAALDIGAHAADLVNTLIREINDR